jgi:hypothetical protein
VEPQKNSGNNRNEAGASTFFLSSAVTLREVKARKTPSASSDVGGVFDYGADGLRPHAIASHAIGRV